MKTIVPCLALALVLAAACGQAADSPLSPAGPIPTLVDVGANGETMKVTAPVLVSPIGGIEITDTDPHFEWKHATAKYAGPQTFTYDFQVIDPDGKHVQSLNIPQQAGAATNFEITEELDFGTLYTWRVRARLGDLVGPWSTTGDFRTFEQFTCVHLGPDPLAIISCHRNQFPAGRHPNKDELTTMMFGVARDFNRVGVPEDHPWGVLLKTTGNNCNGISCDIVCSGDGARQDQYDILLDENVPVFGNAHSGEQIVVRPCMVVR